MHARFSVSTSRYQTNFIKKWPLPSDDKKWPSPDPSNIQLQRQNSHVRQLITRAKAWKKVMWKDETAGKPKSYLISLLVITAYYRVESKKGKLKAVARRYIMNMIKSTYCFSLLRVKEKMVKLVNEIANGKDEYVGSIL